MVSRVCNLCRGILNIYYLVQLLRLDWTHSFSARLSCVLALSYFLLACCSLANLVVVLIPVWLVLVHIVVLAKHLFLRIHGYLRSAHLTLSLVGLTYLLHMDLLLLLRWTCVQLIIAISIVAVQQTFQSLHKLYFLLLDVLLICITWEVDVLSLLGFLAILTSFEVFLSDPWFFFVEVVKSSAVVLLLDVG